jgi:hypothetical protein
MRSASPTEILWRFVHRLRDKLTLTEEACFATDDPLNVYAATAPDIAYIVTYEGSSFNSDGDQHAQLLLETSYISVTLFNRLHSIDESGRSESLIARNTKNLFEMKRRVLGALVGWRLDIEGQDDIEICATTKATRCSKPELFAPREGGEFVAMMSLTFSTSYALNVCEQWGNWYA